MWLLGRLEPDYKSIAEFRRLHREAITEAGTELVRFARSVGLVRGEWIAIDSSKFPAARSARSVGEREAMKRCPDNRNTAFRLNQSPRFVRACGGRAPPITDNCSYSVAISSASPSCRISSSSRSAASISACTSCCTRAAASSSSGESCTLR